MSKNSNAGVTICTRLDAVKAFKVGYSSSHPYELLLTYEGILYKLYITELEEGELDINKFEKYINTPNEQEQLNSQKINSVVKDIEYALSKEPPFAIFIKRENGIIGK